MDNNSALRGVKVLDFTWYGAGPIITRYLAGHGATVVRIESSTKLDRMRVTPPFKDNKRGVNRAPFFAVMNPGKYSITLNLKHQKGLELTKRLASWADIITENFTTGTMKRLGLDYDELKKVNPDVIMLSTTNQGQTGPHAGHPGFGVHLEALCGFIELTGWPDRAPVIHGGFNTDVITARFSTIALLAALDYRRRSGKGQYIDMSQYESGLFFLVPLLLDYSSNNRLTKRRGNRCEYAAPHGVYPCREEEWCAISVFTDDEWQSFCNALGNPGWVKKNNFNTLLSRKANEEELDRRIAKWSIKFSSGDLMVLLQSNGIRAGVVKNSRDIYIDPQLLHRNHWEELKHPEIGLHRYDKPSFRLSKTATNLKKPGPCLGEHTEYVCTNILGLSDLEFTEMLSQGVFD